MTVTVLPCAAWLLTANIAQEAMKQEAGTNPDSQSKMVT
jgi:hypothetical protein